MYKLVRFGLIFFSVVAFANNTAKLDYSLIKKGKSLDDNNTLLVIGGIQGDEPGGFLAASLLATEYEIIKGEVWVVPNLNFPSIIKSSRGLNGDMNRKFSYIKNNDPDFKAVKDIKDLIKAPNVSLIVNLHDGSGFYREKWIDNQLNPKRWGNSSIIDQEKLDDDIKYGNLKEIATRIINNINKNTIKKEHKYHIKNTKTKEGDIEMLKSLTFFAISNKKAAFANEASKTLNSNERVYYHLLALEEYMRVAGIDFKREFVLSPKGVEDIINKEIKLSIFDKKVYLSLNNPRSVIRYVPLPKKEKEIKYEASNPLTAVVKEGKEYKVHYGNRVLTKLVPEYFDYDKKENIIQVDIDGKTRDVDLGSLVQVEEYFSVFPQKNTRVNVIGYTNKDYKNEAGLHIKKDHIMKRFSIDKNGKTFRVELYKTGDEKDKFIGMFLVEFSKLNDENKKIINIANTEKPESKPSANGK